MNRESKSCKSCGIEQALMYFHRHPNMRDGTVNECKKCWHSRLRISRSTPENKKRWKEYGRNSSIKKRYGITTAQYESMAIAQANRCLICAEEPIPNGAFQSDKLHIDHCHITGKIRGLLCHLCNRGIGLFRERSDLLQAAIKYLESHK